MSQEGDGRAKRPAASGSILRGYGIGPRVRRAPMRCTSDT